MFLLYQVLKVSGEWRVASETQCMVEELRSYEAISYEIRGLHPDTRYRMQVRAHNVLGYSLPAQLYVQTALGEYSTENIKPHKAGFYNVYASTDAKTTSSATTSCVSVLFISHFLFVCLFDLIL